MLAALLSLTLWEAARLGHDDFGVREAASMRLAALRPLSWPALALAARSPDIEARTRAGRLLWPSAWAPVSLAIDAHAWWAFYGPDQYDDDRAGSRRWLCPASERFYNFTPDSYHHALAERAFRWGLFKDDVPAIGPKSCPRWYKFGWINVARHRAFKHKTPGFGR